MYHRVSLRNPQSTWLFVGVIASYYYVHIDNSMMHYKVLSISMDRSDHINLENKVEFIRKVQPHYPDLVRLLS